MLVMVSLLALFHFLDRAGRRLLLISNPALHVLLIQLIQLFQANREDAEHVLLLFFRQLAVELEQALFVRLKPVLLSNVLSE